MNKKILLNVLMVAGVSILCACGQVADAADGGTKGGESATKNEKAPQVHPDKVTVYYFHGTRRCPTCLGIQRNINETIDDRFKKEIEAGMLVFEEFNIEEPANKGFVEQFQLSFSTMVVAAQAGDKTIQWENAGRVWDYAHSPDELKNYVETIVRKYLKMVLE